MGSSQRIYGVDAQRNSELVGHCAAHKLLKVPSGAVVEGAKMVVRAARSKVQRNTSVARGFKGSVRVLVSQVSSVAVVRVGLDVKCI